jgi:hypothetical protein
MAKLVKQPVYPGAIRRFFSNEKRNVRKGLLATMLLLALGALPGCGENEQTQSKPATANHYLVHLQPECTLKILEAAVNYGGCVVCEPL